MAKIIKAPDRIPARGYMIFLAGSIETGAAEDWRSRVIEELNRMDITILNPRRDDWDSWVESIENEVFREQVEWELDGLESANIIVVYFSPDAESPISLLELGLFGRNGKTIVVCPKGFRRKGNVDIVCERYGIEQADSIEDLIERIRDRVDDARDEFTGFFAG